MKRTRCIAMLVFLPSAPAGTCRRKDIKATEKVLFVMKGGKVYRQPVR